MAMICTGAGKVLVFNDPNDIEVEGTTPADDRHPSVRNFEQRFVDDLHQVAQLLSRPMGDVVDELLNSPGSRYFRYDISCFCHIKTM